MVIGTCGFSRVTPAFLCILKLLAELGSDGITAFYVFLAVDTFQLLMLILMTGYGIKKAWPQIKDLL
jgi:hypothetical protein